MADDEGLSKTSLHLSGGKDSPSSNIAYYVAGHAKARSKPFVA